MCVASPMVTARALSEPPKTSNNDFDRKEAHPTTTYSRTRSLTKPFLPSANSTKSPVATSRRLQMPAAGGGSSSSSSSSI
eukprot:9428730-Heterocapsa_arctica.AAC.1